MCCSFLYLIRIFKFTSPNYIFLDINIICHLFKIFRITYQLPVCGFSKPPKLSCNCLSTLLSLFWYIKPCICMKATWDPSPTNYGFIHFHIMDGGTGPLMLSCYHCNSTVVYCCIVISGFWCEKVQWSICFPFSDECNKHFLWMRILLVVWYIGWFPVINGLHCASAGL